MSSTRIHRLRVSPLPTWLDADRLLGVGELEREPLGGGALAVTARVTREQAADVAARLRGVGIGGHALVCEVAPPLDRRYVRAARLEDARRRRDTSVGFSKRGVHLDEEGRYSLTPERLAEQLGQLAASEGIETVVDACAGAGGNSIGFARAGCRVVAIERDPARCAMARHNARIYAVLDRIAFHTGDALELVPRSSADLLFVDPPWGREHDRARMQLSDLPLLDELVRVARQGGRYAQLWAKVPASFDPSTLPGCEVRAFFGAASGDERRVKFLLVRVAAATP